MADFCYKNHYLLVAHDQRGHGQTGLDSGEMGFFASGNGWNRIVADVREIAAFLKKTYPTLPLFLGGHSMGSVVVRHCVMDFPEFFCGSIIVGTTIGINRFMRKLGGFIARLEIQSHGEKTPSKRLSQLSFSGYNKKFRPNRTDFDWLSRNPENVDDYLADPLCGFICSSGFYRDLMFGLGYTTDAARLSRIPKNFPLLFLSGQEDAVGGMGKEVTLIAEMLKKNGARNVELILYPLLRHEILCEVEKQLVFKDMLRFLDANRISQD
jgi:alpha-beta hydrolase superfamily lysophospholipase